MTNEPTAVPATADTAPPRRRRVWRRVQVTRVEPISPRMVRVTFTGNDLAGFGWNGPAAHLKLVFPEDGQDEPTTPQPDGPRPARSRTYTPRRFDPSIPELDVEFVLHGEGPASAWAAQARPGHVLYLAGPGPNYQIDPDAAWFLLAGDDAALPAITTILDALPAGARARVLLEVVDAGEERPLTSAAELDVTWFHRGSDSAQADVALEAAIRAVSLPPGVGYVYVGGESTAMRRIRRHLLDERGLAPATVITRGYWKLAAANHTDRDYGTDD